MEREELATKVENLYQMALNRRLYWIHAEQKCETEEERFEVRKAKYEQERRERYGPTYFKREKSVEIKPFGRF